MKRLFCTIVVSVALCLALAGVSLAQHVGDIDISIADNKIVTGERVYGVDLGENTRYFSNEPGYDAIPGIFAPGVSVGFDILGSLKVWNGSDFNTTANARLLLNFDLDNTVTTPTTNTFLPGLSVNTNAANGEWHQHFGMTLRNSSGGALPASPNPLAEVGIYLLELQLRTTQSGIDSSLPYFLVINNGDTELNHAAAIAYQSAVVAVPEPGTWALLVCGLGAVGYWGGKKLRRQIPVAC